MAVNEHVRVILDGIGEGRCDALQGESIAHLEQIRTLLDAHDWQNVNWEGLGWFDEGESLVIIYDAVPADPPVAFVIPIPAAWR
jgi:hypothetical protein